MAPELPELVRRARALAAERDRLIEAVASRWAQALRGQPVSGEDLAELWGALTEEVVRAVLKDGSAQWPPDAVRHEVVAVMGRVRAQVELALGVRSDGETGNA